MFTSPRPNLYVSDAGYAVEVLGRTGLRYIEGQRSMFVDSEVVTGPAGMVVYRDTIDRWDEPHTFEALDDEAKERILNNIRDAFRAHGFEIEVIPP